jgi:hypothetical protein
MNKKRFNPLGIIVLAFLFVSLTSCDLYIIDEEEEFSAETEEYENIREEE